MRGFFVATCQAHWLCWSSAPSVESSWRHRWGEQQGRWCRRRGRRSGAAPRPPTSQILIQVDSLSSWEDQFYHFNGIRLKSWTEIGKKNRKTWLQSAIALHQPHQHDHAHLQEVSSGGFEVGRAQLIRPSQNRSFRTHVRLEEEQRLQGAARFLKCQIKDRAHPQL